MHAQGKAIMPARRWLTPIDAVWRLLTELSLTMRDFERRR
jgi:hypothetical protein